MILRCRLNRKLSWVFAGLFCVVPQFAEADPFLGQLGCVSLQVNVLESGESFGITTEVLRDALRMGLRILVPNLKLDPSCPDRISFKVFTQSLSAGTFRGFYGHVALEVKRKAIFRDTALLGVIQAWDLESYMDGQRDQAKPGVLDHLNRHLAQFAEDYRAANKRE
ncbi:MAG: hypothetical protein C4293_13000 [Nitrospiraceae bacterium]